MPRWPGRRPRRRRLRRSPRRHIPRSAAGVWPKRGSRRRGETGPDGDSSVRPGRGPGFGKCRPPKRDRHSSAKVSYPTLQDMTSEYRRDCSTLARASDSSEDQIAVLPSWLILEISDFANPAAWATPTNTTKGLFLLNSEGEKIRWKARRSKRYDANWRD